ncbi:MAG: hypothetical protein ABI876_11305 [Bacteroidota bacterium]
MTATVACGLCLMACGPRDASETHVDVSTNGGGTDTVVHQNTTIVQPVQTDTVVKEKTVVQQKTDTVVQHRVDTVIKNPAPPTSSVTPQEKARIDGWLGAHADSLNRFSDPKATVYTGGTPLLDEATGKRMDRYDYIVMKHPDHPWLVTSMPRR